ncbi:hypothetical protein N6H14_13315 [Paenibacillus sp. CC-CFT747]|nr:hypothetical protein N6H14_13315 [Paenibacillus sp. CC-CFT747]
MNEKKWGRGFLFHESILADAAEKYWSNVKDAESESRRNAAFLMINDIERCRRRKKSD